VFATLYRSLGIDPHGITIRDFNGRPNFLVDSRYSALPELIG
jgi:hypothetical protein